MSKFEQRTQVQEIESRPEMGGKHLVLRLVNYYFINVHLNLQFPLHQLDRSLGALGPGGRAISNTTTGLALTTVHPCGVELGFPHLPKIFMTLSFNIKSSSVVTLNFLILPQYSNNFLSITADN